jgi:AraC-like DNA-binding protein
MTPGFARTRGASASLEAATLDAEAKREWQFPELTIRSGIHSQALLPDQQATVLLPVDSPLTLLQGKVEQILRPPYDLLFLPAGEKPERLGSFRGLAIQVDPIRLCRISSELSGFRLSTRRCHQRLHDLRVIRARQQTDRDLVLALHQILQVLTLPGLEHNNMLALIGLELPVYRNLALLLCSDLIQKGRSRGSQPQSSKVHIIDELLEWIQANLDRQIQLHDLEERSGYSQRSLRNMFQDRFGCGPIHWIRSQRLEAARARLLDPEQNDTVSTIALAHGYQHLSQFSRDFQASYGMKPSELLREGLRGQH